MGWSGASGGATVTGGSVASGASGGATMAGGGAASSSACGGRDGGIWSSAVVVHPTKFGHQLGEHLIERLHIGWRVGAADRGGALERARVDDLAVFVDKLGDEVDLRGGLRGGGDLERSDVDQELEVGRRPRLCVRLTDRA